MKKIIAAALFIFVLLLPSCSAVSMKDLGAPLGQSYTAVLEVKTEGEPTSLSVIKDGGTMTLVVDEKYTFVCSDGKWVVSYSGLTVPLSSDAAKRSVPHKVASALNIPNGSKWSVTTEIIDGKEVYRCEDSQNSVSLFFDEQTKLPIKLISGNVEATVIKFEPAQ